jgi:hypothetical protein
LQQRLNRKTPTPELLRDFPAGAQLYDILREGQEDLLSSPSRSGGVGCASIKRAEARQDGWGPSKDASYG